MKILKLFISDKPLHVRVPQVICYRAKFTPMDIIYIF